MRKLGNSEEILDFHTDDELDEDDAALRLRGLLRSKNFTKGLLKRAHEKLISVRRTKPDAGALALCIDANHALSVARLLEEITGEATDILVSDTDISTTEVDEYRNSDKKWIVAVRMISEGVDIQRLMVLAYLTNTTTELFFRQAVGRIVRYQKTDFDTEAYCFIPDDPKLGSHAARIEEFQAQAIVEEKERERDDVERTKKADQILMQVLNSSDANFAGLITKGRAQQSVDGARVRDLAEEFQIPEVKIAALIERLAFAVASPASERAVSEQSRNVPLEERLTDLRRKCSKLAARLAIERMVDPKDIHFEYMKIANIAQPVMTESQLEAKIQWLLARLNSR